ncbi:9666_t:CDS:2 [Ambispora gerdemannii]|uniref:Acyl carrier protein n=1 Tax=Ambispora gerdemannii TaxID=144530 RepID=A0A9N9B7S1_9GLOM|nr:9666_t:CDS:2 [Ambispora gerdemannii]
MPTKAFGSSLLRLRPAGFSIFHNTSKNYQQQRPGIKKSILESRVNFAFDQYRLYSSGGVLSRQDIESRIVQILKDFDKVDPEKVTPKSRFAEELGLDSLDAVEVVMAIEEEFSVEIPDKEADEIRSINDAIEYISKHPDAS